MAFGLGRGLEALIPNKPQKPTRPQPSEQSGANEVELSAIVPNPHQPRKQFKLPELEDLAASIREHGILEPLVVSPGKTTGKFVLVAGERRLRAAELAGLKRVPIVVRQTDDQEKLELALIENIQRQDLNPLEEAKALRKLLRDFGMSQTQVAKQIGRSTSAVANCLRLLDLSDEVQRALLSEQITEGHAKCIVTLTKQDQVALLHDIIAHKLSVRQTEQRARVLTTTPYMRKRQATQGVATDPTAQRLGRSLSRHLGARVEVTGSSRQGRISIAYHGTEERDRIADAILAGSSVADPSVADSESPAESSASTATSRSEFTV